MQRLQSQRGTPTLADYRLLENITGLKGSVAPMSEYYRAVDELNKMINANISDIYNGIVKQYAYPNGRVVDWKDAQKELDLIKRAKYNNFFYDPATYAEYNWQVANGITKD